METIGILSKSTLELLRCDLSCFSSRISFRIRFLGTCVCQESVNIKVASSHVELLRSLRLLDVTQPLLYLLINSLFLPYYPRYAIERSMSHFFMVGYP